MAEPPTDSADAAWVRVPTTLTEERLRRLLEHTEFVFRLNPHYHVRDFRRTAPSSYHAEFRNESIERDLALDLVVETDADGRLTLRYDRGIKDRTVFAMEPAPTGAVLVVTDVYDRLPVEERQARLGEVDRSLPAWGEALRMYCVRYQRWSWLPGWRRYMHGPWMRMTPRARRIVWLLWLISLAEFAFFLFVLLIWTIEHR